jgi:hypothetical protein
MKHKITHYNLDRELNPVLISQTTETDTIIRDVLITTGVIIAVIIVLTTGGLLVIKEIIKLNVPGFN